MGKLTLSGAMPSDGQDGLARYADDFLKDPRKLRLVVALVSTAKTIENHVRPVIYPVVQLVHWELVLGDEKSQHAAAKLLGDALAARTGAVQLPFEPGDYAPVKEAPFPEMDIPDDEEAREG